MYNSAHRDRILSKVLHCPACCPERTTQQGGLCWGQSPVTVLLVVLMAVLLHRAVHAGCLGVLTACVPAANNNREQISSAAGLEHVQVYRVEAGGVGHTPHCGCYQ